MDILVGLEIVEKVLLQVKCVAGVVSVCPWKLMVEHRSAHRYFSANNQCDKCKSRVGKIDVNGRIA